MSWFITDSRGGGGDFLPNGALYRMARELKGAMGDFARRRHATDQERQEIAREAETIYKATRCRWWGEMAYHFSHMKGDVYLSNGTEDYEPPFGWPWEKEGWEYPYDDPEEVISGKDTDLFKAYYAARRTRSTVRTRQRRRTVKARTRQRRR